MHLMNAKTSSSLVAVTVEGEDVSSLDVQEPVSSADALTLARMLSIIASTNIIHTITSKRKCIRKAYSVAVCRT